MTQEEQKAYSNGFLLGLANKGIIVANMGSGESKTVGIVEIVPNRRIELTGFTATLEIGIVEIVPNRRIELTGFNANFEIGKYIESGGTA